MKLLRNPFFAVVTLILLLLLVVLQYHLWLGQQGIVAWLRLSESVAEQRAVNESLAQRRSQLAAQAHSLRNDLDEIEFRARHDLGLVKPGETFIHMPDH